MMRLPHAFHGICDAHLPGLFRSSQPHDDVCVAILLKHDLALCNDDIPSHADRILDHSICRLCTAIPVSPVDRQRRLEGIPRRDEARRVRHHDDLRRDLRLNRGRARRRRAPRYDRRADLPDELAERKLAHALPVFADFHAAAPARERLEPARRHRAYAPEHLRPRAAAGLDAARAKQVPAKHRKHAVVDVVERMARLARRGKMRHGIGHLLVSKDVYPLVHDRDERGRCAARLEGDGRRRALLAADGDIAFRDPDGDLVLGRAHRDRRLSVGARGHVLCVRLDALHDGHVHVEVRRVIRRDRPERDLARRVREREDVCVRVLLAQHRHERPAGERRADHQARRLSYAVERLVGRERDRRRVGQRSAHRRVAPVAQVEGLRKRHARLGISHSQRVVAADAGGNLERSVLPCGNDDLGGRRDDLADALAIPCLPSVRLAAVRVNGVDALQGRQERAAFPVARAVRLNAGKADLRRSPLVEPHPRLKRGADVVRVVVENRGGARRRGAPAVLEHGSLGHCAHRGLRQPRIGPERRGHGAFAFAVERSLRKCPEIRLEAEVGVPERPPLPLRRRERVILEHDCALAGERVGRTAEKVFRGDDEREVRRMRRGVRLDLDAYLRRRELLDLYPRRPEYAAVLAGNLRLELPRAARLVCGDGKLIAQKRPLGVGRRREV